MLEQKVLVDMIRRINDTSYPNFEDFPGDKYAAAARWAEAMKEYAKDIIPKSVSLEAAGSAMENVLKTIEPRGGGIGKLELSIIHFADVLATGMSPLFTGSAPTSGLDFNDIYYQGLSGESAKVIAEQLAARIHNWMKTGTAINNNSGATVNWS